MATKPKAQGNTPSLAHSSVGQKSGQDSAEFSAQDLTKP